MTAHLKVAWCAQWNWTESPGELWFVKVRKSNVLSLVSQSILQSLKVNQLFSGILLHFGWVWAGKGAGLLVFFILQCKCCQRSQRSRVMYQVFSARKLDSVLVLQHSLFDHVWCQLFYASCCGRTSEKPTFLGFRRQESRSFLKWRCEQTFAQIVWERLDSFFLQDTSRFTLSSLRRTGWCCVRESLKSAGFWFRTARWRLVWTHLHRAHEGRYPTQVKWTSATVQSENSTTSRIRIHTLSQFPLLFRSKVFLLWGKK